MSGISYEQVNYDRLSDIKPILTNLVHTYHHWHEDIEIVFVCQGLLSLDIHGENRLLQQGEIAIINAEEIHSVNSGRDEPGSGVLMLQISPRFLRGLHIDSKAAEFRQPDDSSPYVDKIRGLLLAIIDEMQHSRPSYKVAVYGYCSNIIALLCRHYRLPQEEGNQKSRRGNERNLLRLKRIFSYIREHYQENPSVADVAASEFISPYHLSHFFSKAAGMTYTQYLNSVKVDMVLQDLIETEDSVTDIMLRHGFSNTKTFHRIFKQRLGCSPTEYRRSIAVSETERPSTPHTDPKLGSYVNFSDGVKIPDSLYRKSGNTVQTDSPPVVAQTIRIPSGESDTAVLDRYFCFMTATARASDLLRSGVQNHIRQVQRELGFQYIRFHNLFGDEMGILHPSGDGIRYNFTYIDTIFDFLMEIGLKPFLELGFMPSILASGKETIFFYKGNTSPPRDYTLWGGLIRAFTEHIVKRYTLREVRTWYFEVWNEPNIDFWSGSYEQYLELYRVSVAEIKAVDPLLKVGGPALSSFQFGDAKNYLGKFLRDCADQALPLDFVSGHPYPAFYYAKQEGMREVLCDSSQTKRDMEWIRDMVKDSAYPAAELHLNEWNSTSSSTDLIHDTAFMAAFVLHNYFNCDGIADSLAFWGASDLFEEGGVPDREFHGGFGLLNKSGLKKPQYFAFQYMTRLQERIIARGTNYIATQGDRGIQILAWNYRHYNTEYAAGDKKRLSFYDRYGVFEPGNDNWCKFKISLAPGDYMVEEAFFDREHGSVFDFWNKHGGIENPSPRQMEIIRNENHLQERLDVLHSDGVLELDRMLPPFGFVFYEISKI